MVTLKCVAVVWSCCVGVFASISPISVRNKASDEIYKDVLIEPIINNFRTFVNGERSKNYAYIPNDVFLAQSIKTMEHVMFQLGTFYAIHKTNNGLPITLFEKGFAIQFESFLCDDVYSSKFPRKKPTVTPWKFFTDSAYFHLNCGLPQKERKPINSRKKRAININTNPLCGPISRFYQNFGNLTFPADGRDGYSSNMECQWTIEVTPTFGVHIEAYYVLLEENDPKCYYDYVTFFEGEGDTGTVIDRVCGNKTRYTVRSNRNIMTIKFKADETNSGRGFMLNWRLTEEIKDHPGFVMTSMIVIDQHGDLNIDTTDFSTLESHYKFVPKVNSDFKLIVEEPQTCTAESNDPHCVFQTKPYLVSKIIATGVSPDFRLEKDAIHVVFEHAIQQDLYPALYDAPKYCVTWDPTVRKTKFGSWTRRNGKTLFTNRLKTTCAFSDTGVHAVIAMAPPPVDPEPFRFTRSWYCGHMFAVIWITITFIKLTSGPLIIPVWLNINQLLAVLVFCGICLCGVHTEQEQSACSFLAFALYYFGFSVFVWHLLKAAQYTGAFDKFFRQDRNLYAFYLLLGWGTPLFVVGIAGGIQLIFNDRQLSCWMAIKGGPIWGYTAPAYFIIVCILLLYYKGVKKDIAKLMKYNYTKLFRRTIRDLVQLILFLITWATGVLSFHQEGLFLHQYLFCISLSLTVVSLCIFARQSRRSFEKIHDKDDFTGGTEDYDEQDYFIKQPDVIFKMRLARTYWDKWRKRKEPQPLRLALKLLQFEGAEIEYETDKCFIRLREKQEYIDPSYFAAEKEFHYENDNESVCEDEVDYAVMPVRSNDKHKSSRSSSSDSDDATENLIRKLSADSDKEKGTKESKQVTDNPPPHADYADLYSLKTRPLGGTAFDLYTDGDVTFQDFNKNIAGKIKDTDGVGNKPDEGESDSVSNRDLSSGNSGNIMESDPISNKQTEVFENDTLEANNAVDLMEEETSDVGTNDEKETYDKITDEEKNIADEKTFEFNINEGENVTDRKPSDANNYGNVSPREEVEPDDNTQEDISDDIINEKEATQEEDRSDDIINEKEATQEEDRSDDIINEKEATQEEDGSDDINEKEATQEEDGSDDIINKKEATQEEDGSDDIINEKEATQEEDGSDDITHEKENVKEEDESDDNPYAGDSFAEESSNEEARAIDEFTSDDNPNESTNVTEEEEAPNEYPYERKDRTDNVTSDDSTNEVL